MAEDGDVLGMNAHGDPVIKAGDDWFQGLVRNDRGGTDEVRIVAPMLNKMEELGITSIKIVEYQANGHTLMRGEISHEPITDHDVI